ncbi:pre-toxin TG domain-containing protein [Rummeliibacillus pycnus]|uniref:pre-toxin TG domain-containing protein n=1 Tax=Rummeliibacillus pycnus TaxID=101070 RepID=UPI000C9B99EF|nr:pre-toxin TG domain-containing protein [Rummeliibacillus pycnus]
MKLLYEDAKWKKVALALQNVNEAHKYDNKYEDADELFKDSKNEISEKDVDHAISFNPQVYQPEAKPIRQDYKKLYDYAKGIGKIIDEKVDSPFYKSIDGYIQKMVDFNVTSYSTTNTINVQEGFLFSGAKEKITLNDLYEANSTYSAKLKTEYEAWKLQNPNEKASKEDYRQAALNSGAFAYEGIRAGQEKKEFWYNLIAAGVVIGLSIVCPPAGLAAGAVYTAIDLAGAAKGKDLISGRKLSDNERLTRGVFAIAPGVGGLAVKSLLKNVPALANVLKTTTKTIDDAVKPLKNTIDGVKTKSKAVYATVVSNAKKLGGQHVDQLKYALSHPVGATVTSKTGQKTIRGSAKFIDNALRPVEVRTVQTTAGNKVFAGIGRGESTGKLAEKADSYIAIKQVEKDALKGTGNTVSDYLDNIIKNGNVDADKLNKLKNTIQNNTFSKDELAEISKKMSDLGIAKEYNEALIKIDFGKYLKGLIGDPPANMINPHAHHILFKKGLGEAQQKLVQEGQELLRKYGIDPIIGEENLVWAPNRIAGQHSIEALENVINQLKAVDAAGADVDDIIEILEDLGKQAASRK